MSRRKVGVSLGLVAALLIAIFVFWLTANNQASITPASAEQRQTAVPDKTFRDAYMTFRYKGSYIAQKQTVQAPDLDVYLLRADTDYSKQLAVSVTAGEATKSSAYILRNTQPSLYSSHQITVDGLPATLWIKADGTEQTIFIQHDDKYALLSFSLTATTVSSDQLTTEVNNLLSTFRWL